MQEPINQHHVTEDGPPKRRGVLNVVAMLEHKPIILKAKLICSSVTSTSIVEDIVLYRGQACEFALEGGSVPHLTEQGIVVSVVQRDGSPA